VISNTTVKRMPNLSDRQAAEKGGLSGKPLTDLSTALIADMYRLTEGMVSVLSALLWGSLTLKHSQHFKLRENAHYSLWFLYYYITTLWCIIY
jgi:dihydroorotate dehydrogenase